MQLVGFDGKCLILAYSLSIILPSHGLSYGLGYDVMWLFSRVASRVEVPHTRSLSSPRSLAMAYSGSILIVTYEVSVLWPLHYMYL